MTERTPIAHKAIWTVTELANGYGNLERRLEEVTAERDRAREAVARRVEREDGTELDDLRHQLDVEREATRLIGAERDEERRERQVAERERNQAREDLEYLNGAELDHDVVTEARRLAAKLAERTLERDAARSMLSAKQLEVSRLTAALGGITGERDKALDDVLRLQAQAGDMAEDVERLTRERDQAESNATALTDKVVQLQGQLAQAGHSLDVERSSHASFTTLEGELAAERGARAQLDQLRTELAEATAKVGRAAEVYDTLRQAHGGRRPTSLAELAPIELLRLALELPDTPYRREPDSEDDTPAVSDDWFE